VGHKLIGREHHRWSYKEPAREIVYATCGSTQDWSELSQREDVKKMEK